MSRGATSLTRRMKCDRTSPSSRVGVWIGVHSSHIYVAFPLSFYPPSLFSPCPLSRAVARVSFFFFFFFFFFLGGWYIHVIDGRPGEGSKKVQPISDFFWGARAPPPPPPPPWLRACPSLDFLVHSIAGTRPFSLRSSPLKINTRSLDDDSCNQIFVKSLHGDLATEHVY